MFEPGVIKGTGKFSGKKSRRIYGVLFVQLSATPQRAVF
jgi:hypothetical protein